jgi:hypothetical protein
MSLSFTQLLERVVNECFYTILNYNS